MATLTASWPVMASTTKSTSSGSAALRTSPSSFINWASIWSRPAVSTITTSRPVRTASLSADLTNFSGLPLRSAWTGTSSRPPRVSNWSIAAGRWRSAATSIGFFPWLLRWPASLAAVVVFPEPWSPTIKMVRGGAARTRPAASDPSVETSSSWTILITCWPGVSDLATSSPTARSLTRARKRLDHRHVDVGLEEGKADLAQCLVDVFFR